VKKHPSSEQIRGMLQEGHFGPSRELPAADPVTVTQLVVEIDRIQPYDHNPRRERNPLYDEIKESIRAQRGLNNPLTITRRPGDTYYMVESGGNTRLHILKELWQETKDSNFYRIHCLFRPWVSEAHVLTAHLIENDKRGDLIFIDKALAIGELRQIIEAETGRQLSLRDLATELQARGYGLHAGLLSRLDYAANVLLPLIPETLRSGLGRPQIDRIRKLESACREYLAGTGDAETATFDGLFGAILSEHDGPDWSLDAVQRQIEARLAEVVGVSLKQVRLEIDARLSNNAAGAVPDPSMDPAPAPGQAAVSTTRQPSLAASTETTSTIGHDPVGGEREQPPTVRARQPPTAAHPVESDHGDLASLRRRSHDLAVKIAERHRLSDCVKQAPDLGMGFLIDLPQTPVIPIAGKPNAMEQLYRQWTWWLLVSLSEQIVHPDRLRRAPQTLVLRDLILEGRNERVLALVGEPDWKALGYEVLSNPDFDNDTVADLLELATTCRRIRRAVADDGGLKLWTAERGRARAANDAR
jgi:ParB family protein of integrating conjugative element (PFGI_1 class)